MSIVIKYLKWSTSACSRDKSMARVGAVNNSCRRARNRSTVPRAASAEFRLDHLDHPCLDRVLFYLDVIFLATRIGPHRDTCLYVCAVYFLPLIVLTQV